MFNCNVFLNADEIARGISPFDVEAVAFEAGRIMLNQIEKHLEAGDTFAIETTLSTRYYVQLTKQAQKNGYKVVLMFLYLKNVEISKARVKKRVELGGHNIPLKVIERRFEKGLSNFFKYFMIFVDDWYFIDNDPNPLVIASKYQPSSDEHKEIFSNLVVRYGK